MQTIVELIEQRKLDVRTLITHRFPVDDAVRAYQLLEGDKREAYLGIVLSFPGADADVAALAPRLSVSSRGVARDRDRHLDDRGW